MNRKINQNYTLDKLPSNAKVPTPMNYSLGQTNYVPTYYETSRHFFYNLIKKYILRNCI